jgi:hypothetical protein
MEGASRCSSSTQAPSAGSGAPTFIPDDDDDDDDDDEACTA